MHQMRSVRFMVGAMALVVLACPLRAAVAAMDCGTFAPEVLYGVDDDLSAGVAIGDLDGEGDLDLAVANAASDTVSILMNNCISPCPADVDGSDDVGFTDILGILTNWGPCSECSEDIDGNGDVGFTNLLAVLSSWGPCLE